MTRAIASTIFGATCLCLAACTSNNPSPAGTSSSSGSGSGSSGAGGPSTITVMFDFATTDPKLNGGKGQVVPAHVGDTVVWKNDDVCPQGEIDAGMCTDTPGTGEQHSIASTGDAGAWGMYGGTLATGSAASPPIVGQFTFTSAGTYTYQCSIHGPMMIGEVDVTP
jgi:plastocyanin